MVSFDPYLNWLGIPQHEQPPNFYRLLGVVLFESNPEVIEQAADLQSLRVGGYQAGPQGELCQQLMTEIAMARFCLLDPQQKAAYDGQLQQGLAQRGERAVASPPPPAQFAASGQPSSPPPQFAMGMGSIPIGQAAPGPMNMPSPLPPMQAPLQGMAATSAPAAMPMAVPQQRPIAPMPQAMASSPPGFAPGMPHPSAPVALPVAAPFPVPRAAVATPAVARAANATTVPAAPAAPPITPPAAPQRPLDALENLASQPTTRRRLLKRKPKADYTKEIIIGSVVTAAGVLLFVVYAALKHEDPTPHGFGAFEHAVEKPADLRRSVIESSKKLAEEIKQKEKEKEKKVATEHTAGRSGNVGPLRPFGETAGAPKTGSQSADDDDSPFHARYKFGAPSRAMDSPDPGHGVESVPQVKRHDTPQDLGGANDPVMDTPKPD